MRPTESGGEATQDTTENTPGRFVFARTIDRFRRDSRTIERFRGDDRAIEGLPIRLVIALVVGVASLSVMMSMVSGIGGLGVTELDADPDPDVITAGESHDVEIAIVDPDGRPVADATVVLQEESARLEEGIRTAETNADGVATIDVEPELGPNQRQGSLSIDIKPPAGSDYVDRRANTEILVLER